MPLRWQRAFARNPGEEWWTLTWGDRILAEVNHCDGGDAVFIKAMDGKTRKKVLGLDDARAFAMMLVASQLVEAAAHLLNHGDDVPVE